jgi:signal transduction histidine kinase
LSERIHAGQNQALRLLAEGQPLAAVLDALCRALEAALPQAACSILILDEAGERLHHAAAPSLAPAYTAAIDGVAIGPVVGSCGTAAYRRATVVVEDIAVDPLWTDWRELALRHGLRACWSVPIIDRQADRVLGTFAVYYGEPRPPAADELALVEQSGDLAGVAIVHARDHTALVAANRAKGGLLAMLSHELRTPLQAVLGYAEFLLDDPRASLTPEQRDDLSFIQQGGRRMLTLINQMLDLSRLDAGGLQLDRKPVALADILEQVRQDVAPQASAKCLALQIALPEGLPPVWGDAERLRQILLNLVGNAVKFTERGSVAVSAAAIADETVAVTVCDTGIGIAPDVLPHIFEPFRQADHRLSRRHGGAGLGLAIAQRLAALMDGRITVESALGEGSIFTLSVPVTPPTRG